MDPMVYEMAAELGSSSFGFDGTSDERPREADFGLDGTSDAKRGKQTSKRPLDQPTSYLLLIPEVAEICDIDAETGDLLPSRKKAPDQLVPFCDPCSEIYTSGTSKSSTKILCLHTKDGKWSAAKLRPKCKPCRDLQLSAKTVGAVCIHRVRADQLPENDTFYQKIYSSLSHRCHICRKHKTSEQWCTHMADGETVDLVKDIFSKCGPRQVVTGSNDGKVARKIRYELEHTTTIPSKETPVFEMRWSRRNGGEVISTLQKTVEIINKARVSSKSAGILALPVRIITPGSELPDGLAYHIRQQFSAALPALAKLPHAKDVLIQFTCEAEGCAEVAESSLTDLEASCNFHNFFCASHTDTTKPLLHQSSPQEPPIEKKLASETWMDANMTRIGVLEDRECPDYQLQGTRLKWINDGIATVSILGDIHQINHTGSTKGKAVGSKLRYNIPRTDVASPFTKKHITAAIGFWRISTDPRKEDTSKSSLYAKGYRACCHMLQDYATATGESFDVRAISPHIGSPHEQQCLFVNDDENIYDEQFPQDDGEPRKKLSRVGVDVFEPQNMLLENLPDKSTVTLIVRSIDSWQLAHRGQQRFFRYWQDRKQHVFRLRFIFNGFISDVFPASIFFRSVEELSNFDEAGVLLLWHRILHWRREHLSYGSSTTRGRNGLVEDDIDIDDDTFEEEDEEVVEEEGEDDEDEK